MSKAIKWQIPFVSTIDKIHYRIDIYAEGYSGDPIQLTGGTNPIKTEEDKSDDFFAPVRGQTGTIEVVTKLPNGGTLDINDLLPANNIDHPVRLVSISGSTETIEWQGFMSCEAYSQNYTSVPDTFSFPIISVLEAMDSIFINKNTLDPLGTIGSALAKTLNEVRQVCDGFYNVHFPKRDFDIWGKRINTSALLESNTIQNQEQVIYKIKGISLKSILTIICKYMGWTAREYQRDLFFEEMHEYADMCMTNALTIIGYGGVANIDPEYIYDSDIEERNISDLTWRGIDHRKSVKQGARSVKVVANLVKFDVGMEIPDTPYSASMEHTTHMQPYYVYMLASDDPNAYSNLAFYGKKAMMSLSGSTVNIGTYTDTDLESVIENSLPYAGTNSPAKYIYDHPGSQQYNYAGAFLTRMQIDNLYEDIQHQNAQDGLYVSLFGGVWAQSREYNPIFRMKSTQVFATYENGYINLKAAMRCFLNSLGIGTDANMQLQASLKIGEYNWTGGTNVRGWSTTNMSHFFIDFNNTCEAFEGNWNDQMGIDETDGLLIPVGKDMQGEIEFCIYPETVNTTTIAPPQLIFGIFFSQLSVSFIQMRDIKRTDRSNNTFYMELPTNFREDKSIETDIASWLNNAPSPSLIFNGANETPMQKINYQNANGTTVARRPEVDLLNRMASYYGSARQRLEVVVKHPMINGTPAPLPLLRLNGISPDTRQYTPLAESRDWINDTSTIKCFETI